MKKKLLKSFYPKKDSPQENWVLYDAKDIVLGKAAADITSILLGKNLPTYTPGVNSKQHVVVINTEKITVTGNKYEEKKYYSHSGYPGGLKEATYKELLAKKPTDPLRAAIKGMLPKNSYGRSLQKNVLYYKDDKHKHEAQNPVEYKKG